MRSNPDRGHQFPLLFTGSEQDRLARELTPLTLEYRKSRIAQARRGLTQLRGFDRARPTAVQRVSRGADGLAARHRRERRAFSRLFVSLLEQMNGANVNLVETLTVRYPILNERDAENYLAVLGQRRRQAR